MYVIVNYIVFAMRNESTMVNSKRFRYCIIVLHYSAWSNNLAHLTGTHDAMFIDFNMDIQRSLPLHIYNQIGVMAQLVRAPV